MSSDARFTDFATRAIHAGQEADPTTGAVIPPLYQSTTYKQDGVGGFRNGYEYTRGTNPTRTALETQLAALEGGDRGFSFASGLAAEDALLRSIVQPGDHVLMGNDVYGGTHRLVNRLVTPWGIELSTAEMTEVFEAAKAHGLPVKLHADQLSNLHGAELAARYGALSADHLEYTDDAGAAAMAKAGTVAVILPGAFYFIRETKKPPVDLFRKHGVKMAVATDCNPGTSPLTSLLLTMNMAATLFGLTVDECLAGTTREAARALGLLDRTGTLEAGKSADLAIWDIERPAELVYRMGFNPLHARIWRGQ